MNKQQIRQYIRQTGQSVTDNERQECAKNIFTKIEALERFAAAQTIALYIGLPDEVPTLEWIERLQEMGKRVVIPRIKGDEMEFYPYDKGELAQGSFKILEPTGSDAIEPLQIDLIIVPGMAFCRDGRRLGRGKGYYDRYISRKGYRAYSIGVGFAHQLICDIPCESHDKVLDTIITPYVESPISEVMSRVIDSAGSDAAQIGCGVERLIEGGHSWVLLRYKMELARTPEADEPLTIETWISDCSRVVTSRNFVIKSASQEVIGEAISQWCMIDLATRRPTDLTRSEINYPQFIKPRKASIAISGKLPSIDPEDRTLVSYRHQTTDADIDFNNHVNTFSYVDMMLNMLPHNIIAQRGATSLDIQFVHESYLGEELTILHTKDIETENITSTCTSIFEILRQDGSPAVRAKLKLRE